MVYGDGKTQSFVVKNILRFQALQPQSFSSPFRNLDRKETISAAELFNRVYVGERYVVFQTRIDANGDASWGRLFVLAIPKEE